MRLLSFALLFVISFGTHAKDEDNLETLFSLMNMDSMMTSMWSQMESMMTSAYDTKSMSAEEAAIFEKFSADLVALMQNEMSWDAMKVDVKEVYRQNFTNAEIEGMLEFYRTPAGQAVIRTMPQVMQESMKIGQSMAMQAMPKFQALGEKLAKDLEATKAK